MRTRFVARVVLAASFLQVLFLRVDRALPQDTSSLATSRRATAAVLSLRFVSPRHSFEAKGPIEIQATIKNDGTETILMCRELRPGGGSTQPCDWEFSIRDAKGRSLRGVKWAADRVVGPPDEFATVLIKEWIALAPGYSYSTLVDVGIGFGNPPPIPGRYEISGTLTSHGPDSKIIYNDLAAYPRELEKLPYPGWKGEMKSNKIWITIDPPDRKP